MKCIDTKVNKTHTLSMRKEKERERRDRDRDKEMFWGEVETLHLVRW